MHRVVLWVEQGRQVVDSQLVCTTPAAGLRVMLANHSRSGGCTFAIRNRYLSVPLARCVHHSRRKICTFYKFMAEANPIDRSRALGGCRRCGRGAFCFSASMHRETFYLLVCHTCTPGTTVSRLACFGSLASMFEPVLAFWHSDPNC